MIFTFYVLHLRITLNFIMLLHKVLMMILYHYWTI